MTKSSCTLQNQPQPFPKLMRHKRTGTIGLFSAPEEFVTVVETEKSTLPFGRHSFRRVEPQNWEDYYGSVTITSTKD